MTDPVDTPHLPQLDHDADGKAGGAKKPAPRTAPTADDFVWVVSRANGLHRVPSGETATVLHQPGGRMATARDLEIGGVEQA